MLLIVDTFVGALGLRLRHDLPFVTPGNMPGQTKPRAAPDDLPANMRTAEPVRRPGLRRERLSAMPRQRSTGSTSSNEESAEHAYLLVPRGQFAAELAGRIELGEQIAACEINSTADLEAARSDWYTWDDVNDELLKRRFTTPAIQKGYSGSGAGVFFPIESFGEKVADFRRDVLRDVRRLRSIEARLPLIDEASSVSEARGPVTASSNPKAKTPETIFVVHGHNDAAKLAVHGFLRDVTKLDPVILHNEPNRGLTVIEKFESVGASAGFAVVVMTADDVGRAKDDTIGKPRGRQNVVFEFGYFVGTLGRPRVVVLYQDGVELPSDINGLIYIQLDPAGGWKALLAKELKAAGIEVDAERLIS